VHEKFVRKLKKVPGRGRSARNPPAESGDGADQERRERSGGFSQGARGEVADKEGGREFGVFAPVAAGPGLRLLAKM